MPVALLSMGQITVFQQILVESHRGLLGANHLTCFIDSPFMATMWPQSLSHLQSVALCSVLALFSMVPALTGKAKELDLDTKGDDSTETGADWDLWIWGVNMCKLCDGVLTWLKNPMSVTQLRGNSLSKLSKSEKCKTRIMELCRLVRLSWKMRPFTRVHNIFTAASCTKLNTDYPLWLLVRLTLE